MAHTVTQRQHPLARRVSSVTSNLIKIVILINNKITVKAAFNYGKCKFLLNLVEILQLLGNFWDPYISLPPLVYSTNTTLSINRVVVTNSGEM